MSQQARQPLLSANQRQLQARSDRQVVKREQIKVLKRKTALLVIDVQQEWYSGCPQITHDFPDLPHATADLINACRQSGECP